MFTLTLDLGDTSAVAISGDDDSFDCVYDLELVDPDGLVFKPARGTFTIHREVTR